MSFLQNILSSIQEDRMVTSPLLFELEEVRQRWGWLLFLGIVMVVLGTIALFIMPAATIGTVLVLGWLLVFSGIMETIQAVRERKSGVLFMHLIGGILRLLVALLVVTHPVVGAVAWTLMFTSFLTVIRDSRLCIAVL